MTPGGEHGHSNGSSFGEIEYHNLTPGPHCFYVYATDQAGNVGPTTQYCWTISGTVTATTITATGGTPQSTSINTSFATALQATVTGAGNVPVPGRVGHVHRTVDRDRRARSAVVLGCTGLTCTVTTNASGIATAGTFTANGIARRVTRSPRRRRVS